ncbi:MAG: PEP-CTERM sorting domain-containing protein [Planctomycetaceae bacterium]|nr:MAG: PEP-CTERM sorting domain-containing protein [Planctomycetaceae bacterium]
MKAIKRSATGIVVSMLITSAAFAVQVDLNLWTAESYPAVTGFPAGAWTVNSSGQSVTQVANGQPTLFYSDFNVRGMDVRGSVSVANGDDDYIGFAFGFQPGDTSNAAADYLLVDWKGATQFFDFDGLSTTPGTTAVEGLAVSRVTGVPTADEFWGHTDFADDPSGGVAELARGATLGSTGWVAGVEYDLQFLVEEDRLQVFVDDVLELDISGDFPDGRMAFYNFSQGGVTYRAFTRDTIPPGPCPVIPVPASLPLVILGVAGVLIRRLRG